LVVLFSCAASVCLSQSRERLKEKTFNPFAFEAFKVEIKKIKDNPLELGYGNALFIDCRADSSRIGFALTGINTEYHRMVFPKPAAAYLTEKAAGLIAGNSNSKNSLVYVLKHLWIKEVIVPPGTWGQELTNRAH